MYVFCRKVLTCSLIHTRVFSRLPAVRLELDMDLARQLLSESLLKVRSCDDEFMLRPHRTGFRLDRKLAAFEPDPEYL